MGVDVIVRELNRLYIVDKDKYKTECDDLKRMGYQIYRNSDGVHKVFAPEKPKDKKTEQMDAFKDMFGEIFGADAFGGMFE